MERFIMSVKHWERCTMPAEAARVTGREVEPWSHEVTEGSRLCLTDHCMCV